MHPDFKTKEEDWPDIDGDSGTEEHAAAMELSQAAMHSVIARSTHQGYHQHPNFNISEALYDKAREHQDELTLKERQLLLGRGDLVGRALAYPESLTVDEMHTVLLWPPPDVVRGNIQSATGGNLSTPTELYAKIKDAIERRQLETMLSRDEIILPTQFFHTTTYNVITTSTALGELGGASAMMLLMSRMGLDFDTHGACKVYAADLQRATAQLSNASRVPPHLQAVREYRRATIDEMVSLHKQFELGNVTANERTTRNAALLAALSLEHPQSSLSAGWVMSIPITGYWPKVAINSASNTDLLGLGDWPPVTHGTSQSALLLFMKDVKLDPRDSEACWFYLPEDQKEVYRAQSETLYHECWAEHETRIAQGTSHFPPAAAAPPQG